MIEIREDSVSASSPETKSIWWIDESTLKWVFDTTDQQFILNKLVSEMRIMRGIGDILSYLSTIDPKIQLIYDTSARNSSFKKRTDGNFGKAIVLNKFGDIEEELIHAYYAYTLNLQGSIPYHRALNAELDAKLYNHLLNKGQGGTSSLAGYSEAFGLLVVFEDQAMQDGIKYEMTPEQYKEIYNAFKRDIDKKHSSIYHGLKGNELFTDGLYLIYSLLDKPDGYGRTKSIIKEQ